MKFKRRYCPECGGDIKFSYVTPEKSFEIDASGDIERDDANIGPIFDSPNIEFYCSHDREHDINLNRSQDDKFEEWQEEIINVFYRQNMHTT